MGSASSIASSLLPNTLSSPSSPVANPKMALKPSDFINMMVTQLKNQDPLNPTSNSELLSQMSQIGQLQSSQDLQSSIKTMVLQNQVGSGSSLIGKQVSGTDANANPVSGLVSSVQVSGTAVSLQLSNGSSLPMSQVTSIAFPVAAAAASGS